MNSEEPNVTVNTRQKDTVFRILFKDKKNLLQLYNALNDSEYTDAEQLAIVTHYRKLWSRLFRIVLKKAF